MTTYRARWVYPVVAPPIDGGYVAVREGRIDSVGRRPEGPVVDLGQIVLLPALVNAHVHLEFSHLEAPLGPPGQDFADWIPRAIAARLEGQDRQQAIARGLAESAAGGARALGEIARPGVPLSAYAEFPGAVVACRELIGPTAETAEAFPLDPESPPPPSVEHALSPHAPYTVHPRLLARALERMRGPASRAAVGPSLLAMHLAESLDEVEFLATGRGRLAEALAARGIAIEPLRAGRRTPGDLLPELAAAGRALVVHGNYLSEADFDFLAERRDALSLAHCPRTHAFFGRDAFPLARRLSRGIRVVLGTDSRATNPDLDMLAELRFAAERYGDVSSERLVEMATRSAAEALGLPDRGQLASGAAADFLTIDYAGGAPADAIVGR